MYTESSESQQEPNKSKYSDKLKYIFYISLFVKVFTRCVCLLQFTIKVVKKSLIKQINESVVKS